MPLYDLPEKAKSNIPLYDLPEKPASSSSSKLPLYDLPDKSKVQSAAGPSPNVAYAVSERLEDAESDGSPRHQEKNSRKEFVEIVASPDRKRVRLASAAKLLRSPLPPTPDQKPKPVPTPRHEPVHNHTYDQPAAETLTETPRKTAPSTSRHEISDPSALYSLPDTKHKQSDTVQPQVGIKDCFGVTHMHAKLHFIVK